MPSEPSDAKLRWENETLPVSTRFDDPYYSRQDGLAESTHVFLDGNNLSERFAAADDFHIAELGFGTGLNVLAAIALWHAKGATGTLNITSFERYPLTESEIALALSPWAQLSELAKLLLKDWPTCSIRFPNTTLTLVLGDVNETLPGWAGQADAWFLDGFAPARNPEMWTAPVMSAIGMHTRTQGTFATYTAAGFVRRGLQAAGFMVEKRPGYGSKREMLTGSMTVQPESHPT